jgi:hypothetical protein
MGFACFAIFSIVLAAHFSGLNPWLRVGAGLLGLLVLANVFLWRIPIFPYDQILSAHSTDAINWDKEPGVRIRVGGQHLSCQVYFPKVVELERGYRMYYRAGGKNSLIASAVSADGIEWREEHGGRLKPQDVFSLERVEPGCVLRVPGGGWWMYYSGFVGARWAIYRASSLDGLMWSGHQCCSELGVVGERVKDPSVVWNGSNYRIFFRIVGAVSGEIYTANSRDGMIWEDICACRGYGARGYSTFAPDVHVIKDRYRMYFTEYDSPSLIGARIVSAHSADGIYWERDGGARLEPGGRFDPHGVFGGQVVGARMYYGGFWQRHLLQPLTLFQRRRLSRG